MTSSNGTFPVPLALCEGNPPVTGGFPSQRPVTIFSLICAWKTVEQTMETWDVIAHNDVFVMHTEPCDISSRHSRMYTCVHGCLSVVPCGTRVESYGSQGWFYRFASSQWETALLYNDVSHWLGASPESALLSNYSALRYTCHMWCVHCDHHQYDIYTQRGRGIHTHRLSWVYQDWF